MNKAIAVIDSGYGDSGKGKMTDYFCHQNPEAINVRFNGGAQAGHTVVTPKDQRHVFSHFGAGSFIGNTTFLSKHFVVSPTLFRAEHQEFVEKFGFKPTVVVDPSAKVTTPYEMLVNQIIEMHRQKGSENHGSVGVGFGETLEREDIFKILIDVATLDCGVNKDDGILQNKLFAIRKNFVPARLNCIQSEFDSVFDSEQLIEDYLGDCRYFFDNVTLGDYTFLQGKDLIFEGAQGLLLDQNYGYFPYVTRSNCGLKNIMDLLQDYLSDYTMDVVYVTRAYATRHGAGPLTDEDPNYCRFLTGIAEETNVTNQFQQNFRLAPFNRDLFEMITLKDFTLHAPRHARKLKAMTCLDQLDNEAGRAFYYLMHIYVQNEFSFFSTGPTRNSVHQV